MDFFLSHDKDDQGLQTTDEPYLFTNPFNFPGSTSESWWLGAYDPLRSIIWTRSRDRSLRGLAGMLPCRSFSGDEDNDIEAVAASPWSPLRPIRMLPVRLRSHFFRRASKLFRTPSTSLNELVRITWKRCRRLSLGLERTRSSTWWMLRSAGSLLLLRPPRSRLESRLEATEDGTESEASAPWKLNCFFRNRGELSGESARKKDRPRFSKL